MTDREFLQWVHDRMVFRYGENPAVDYMHKLRAVIAATSPDKSTPNVCSSWPEGPEQMEAYARFLESKNARRGQIRNDLRSVVAAVENEVEELEDENARLRRELEVEIDVDPFV